MSTLQRMLVRLFLPVFLISGVFFVLVLQMMDLFTNLWRYLAQDTGFLAILQIGLLYLPKCVSFSLPVALLFSIAFVLGSLYANNELIAIFASGVSLYRLIAPFLLIGAVLSVGSFFFEDRVVIETLQRKKEMFQQVVHQSVSLSNTNVTVISEGTRIIYQVDYYNDAQKLLSGVTVLLRDDGMQLVTRVDAERGEWGGGRWTLKNCRIFDWDGKVLREETRDSWSSDRLTEDPVTFQRITRRVEEMRQPEARRWVDSLRRAGLPFREALTDYYKKFFFALTPLIVALLSGAVGSTFRKNILLMSLLSSLVLSVVYYVTQMIGLILAKSGSINPLAGASSSFILFLVAGLLLYRTART